MTQTGPISSAPPAGEPPSRAELDRQAQLVMRALGDGDGVSCLRAKRDGIATHRVQQSGGEPSIIIKTWTRAGLRHVVRDVSGTNECVREWHALQRLNQLGVAVPTPLWRWRGRVNDGRMIEALASEDLGPCVRVGDIMADRLAAADTDAIEHIEAVMIETTTAMIRAGILDLDHSATNFVQASDGHVYRIDLECARRVDHVRHGVKHVAAMLARLIGTYTFAVQPHIDRATGLAARLHEETDLSRRVWDLVATDLDRMFARQARESGVETSLKLPW